MESMAHNNRSKKSEFQAFDSAVDKVLLVSHEELQRREAKWKKYRKRKKTDRNKK
jgi:hypothetical protein